MSYRASGMSFCSWCTTGSSFRRYASACKAIIFLRQHRAMYRVETGKRLLKRALTGSTIIIFLRIFFHNMKPSTPFPSCRCSPPQSLTGAHSHSSVPHSSAKERLLSIHHFHRIPTIQHRPLRSKKRNAVGFLLACSINSPPLASFEHQFPLPSGPTRANSEDKRASGQDAKFQLYALAIKSVTRFLNRYRQNRV